MLNSARFKDEFGTAEDPITLDAESTPPVSVVSPSTSYFIDILQKYGGSTPFLLYNAQGKAVEVKPSFPVRLFLNFLKFCFEGLSFL